MFDYFDYNADDVINLRLHDYDQYPDTSAGKVTRSKRPLGKNSLGSDEYASKSYRKSKGGNPSKAQSRAK